MNQILQQAIESVLVDEFDQEIELTRTKKTLNRILNTCWRRTRLLNTFRQALARLKRIQYGIIVQQEDGDYTVIRCKGDKDIEKITEEITLQGAIVAVKSGSELYKVNGLLGGPVGFQAVAEKEEDEDDKKPMWGV